MRLDHLLSREPILLGSNHGVRPVGGAWFVFLCSHVFTAQEWVVGVGAFFGLGIKGLCERAHCRVHVQHRVSVHLLWWLPAQPASDCCVVGVGVCGGLFVICIVVASIFVLYCFLCFV